MSEVGLIITPMSRLLFHHHGVDPKIPRPRFANGSRSEVPLDSGFNQPISIAAESALKAYGLWASGDPVRRDSPVSRVRHLLAKMVRRHAVYALRPVPTEDLVVLTLGVGCSTDTLVIEMRLRPATIYVRTFGTFSVPRKGETTTKVYEREYTCAQIVAASCLAKREYICCARFCDTCPLVPAALPRRCEAQVPGNHRAAGGSEGL